MELCFTKDELIAHFTFYLRERLFHQRREVESLTVQDVRSSEEENALLTVVFTTKNGQQPPLIDERLR